MYAAPDEEKAVVTVGGRATLPQLFVQNEIAPSTDHAHLRHRNASQEGQGHPKCQPKAQTNLNETSYSSPNASTSSVRSSPAYGTPGCIDDLKVDQGHLGYSPDSGIVGDYSGSPDQSFYGKWEEPQPQDSPQWRSRHRRRRDLGGFPDLTPLKLTEKFYQTENYVLSNIAMVALLVVVFGSVYTFLTLASMVRHSGLDPTGKAEVRNGKYASIEYGHRRRREILEEQGRLIPDQVVSDEGEVLGGKKASIQYAADLKKAEEEKENPEISKPSLEEQIEGLVDELLNDPEDEAKTQEKAEVNRAEKKKVLLDKLRESGHFTTSKVEVIEKAVKKVEKVPVKVEEVKKPVKRVKFGPENKEKSEGKRSKVKVTEEKAAKRLNSRVKRKSLDDAFRKFRAQPSEERPADPHADEEEDPFRFL